METQKAERAEQVDGAAVVRTEVVRSRQTSEKARETDFGPSEILRMLERWRA